MRNFVTSIKGDGNGGHELKLILEEVPFWARSVSWIAGKSCELTRHRFCNSGIIGAGISVEWDKAKTILELPLSQEQFLTINPDDDFFFEEDE